jgi:mRNA-degrading endonuclease RelE of RelBE toxin-antitoxin system
MSYQIALSTEAQHTLARLPAPIRLFTAGQLEKLASDPTGLSRPSRFPYRAKCQLFQFDTEHDGKIWELTTMFQYGQDEQTIHVIAIGHSSRERWE